MAGRRSAMLANRRRAHWENEDTFQADDETLKHQGSSYEDVIQDSESDALRHAEKLKAFTQAEAENPRQVWELQEEPEQEEARLGRPTLPGSTPSPEEISVCSGSKSALSRSGSKSTLSRSGSKSTLSERPPWRAGTAAYAPRGDNDLGQRRSAPAARLASYAPRGDNSLGQRRPAPATRVASSSPAQTASAASPPQQRSVAPMADAHVPVAPAPAPAPSGQLLAPAGERNAQFVPVAAAADKHGESGSEEVRAEAAAHARRRRSSQDEDVHPHECWPRQVAAADAEAGGAGTRGAGTSTRLRLDFAHGKAHTEATLDGEAGTRARPDAAYGRADAESTADGNFGDAADGDSSEAADGMPASLGADDFSSAIKELARYLREDDFLDFYGKLLDEYCIDAVTCSAGAEVRLVHNVMQTEFEGRVEAKLRKRLGKRRLVLVTSGVQELARGETMMLPDLDPEDFIEVIKVLAPTPLGGCVDTLLERRSDRLGRGAHISREQAIRISFFPRLPVCPTDFERELEWVWSGVLPPEPEPDDTNASSVLAQAAAAAEDATEPTFAPVA